MVPLATCFLDELGWTVPLYLFLCACLIFISHMVVRSYRIGEHGEDQRGFPGSVSWTSLSKPEKARIGKWARVEISE